MGEENGVGAQLCALADDALQVAGGLRLKIDAGCLARQADSLNGANVLLRAALYMANELK